MTYLEEGRITKQTEYIKKLVTNLKQNRGTELVGFDFIAKTFKYLDENLPFDRKQGWSGLFHTRTAEDILKDKFNTGCSDVTIVFVTIMRAAGYPTKYIETISKRWLDDIENKDPTIRGHAFSEVLINGNWILVDPDSRRISFNPDKEWDYFEIYGTGLDPHDFDLSSFAKMKEHFYDFREKRNSSKQIK